MEVKQSMLFQINIILLTVLVKSGHVINLKKTYPKENILQQHLKTILVEYIFLVDTSFILMQKQTKCLMIYIC